MYKKIIISLLTLVVLCSAGCNFTDNQTNKSTTIEKAVIENNCIKTNFFTLKVPDSWKGKYDYTIIDSGTNDFSLQVGMVSKSEYKSAHLFSVHILDLNDTDNIEVAVLDEWINPIGILSKNGLDKYMLGYNLASEMACTEEEENAFLLMIDEVKIVIDSITTNQEYELTPWSDGLKAKLFSKIYSAPFVPISFDLLNLSFDGYKNYTDAVFIDIKTYDQLTPYYLKFDDSIKYYYNSENTLIGVKDDDICIIDCFASDLTGITSPQVRDVILAIDAIKLFEVKPAVVEITNSRNSRYFFYWKTENGYIGFTTIGGNNPENCYNYTAYQLVLFENPRILNTVNH
ncbi:MAG: hypothetical protein IIX16_02075 [Clostridia bacterium]|nr:hypothetical protein [Clostridia bacterium]